MARRSGGKSLLRVEDIDVPRVVQGAEARIEDDLLGLGLDWDEPAVRQSERLALYERAIDRLRQRGLVYPCDCSRAEIARAASAPHPGEEGEERVYPGACRERDPQRPMRRLPALRVRVPDEVIAYEDLAAGHVAQNLLRDVGDFVLRRGDGVFAYQLAVVVDDIAMAVTDVVRGADLVSSTPRQIWLATVLGAEPPRFTHVPLVVAEDGARLEKRTPRSSVRELRAAGVAPEAIIGRLAHGLGLAPDDAPRSANEVAKIAGSLRVRGPERPWRMPAQW
jgi:glutamyl-queuosine tRNA(Asp) synthetase